MRLETQGGIRPQRVLNVHTHVHTHTLTLTLLIDAGAVVQGLAWAFGKQLDHNSSHTIGQQVRQGPGI